MYVGYSGLIAILINDLEFIKVHLTFVKQSFITKYY